MRRRTTIIACCVAFVGGCTGDAPPPPVPTARTEGVALSVLVVSEPEIAAAIARLRGDWAELSGGSLSIAEVSHDEFSTDQPLDADIVIYPARYLGALVDGEKIRPLRSSVREDEEVAFGQILPAIRDGELSYGGEYYAVPFGSRVLLTITEPAVGPQAVVDEASDTGHGEGQAASSAAAGEPVGGLVLPANEFSAAYVLLAQAAPKTRHPSQVAVLFDLESMEPQIDGPVFVRALEDLVAAAERARDGSGPPPVWLWWPPLQSDDAEIAEAGGANGTLPSSDMVFDANARAWVEVPGPASDAPLVAAKSWIGSVTASSRSAPAAFRLLSWLAGRSGGAIGRAAVAPVHQGMAGGPIEQAFAQASYLQVPRILQVDAYLAALDEGVRRALQGQVEPLEALHEAAGAWDEITDRIGRERQRAVYRKQLNLP